MLKKQLLFLAILCLAQGASGMEDVDQQLIKASRDGNLGLVRDLIDRGADVNTLDEIGVYSPLSLASQEGHTGIVRFLLEHNADPNESYSCGLSPLFLASGNGHVDVVKLLLMHNANVNSRNDQGRTSLFAPSQAGNIELVRLLLEHGADPNLALFPGIPLNGNNPLDLASMLGRLNTVNLLLKYNANRAAQGGEFNASALMWAANNGHLDVVVALLTTLSNKDEQEIRTHLDKMLSLRFGTNPFPKDIRRLLNKELIRSLAADRMKRAIFLMKQINEDNQTAHAIAVIRNHPAIAKLVDPNDADSQKEIRAKIEANVRRTLLAKPEGDNK